MQVCEVLQLQDQNTLISENAIEMNLTPYISSAAHKCVPPSWPT